MDALLIAAILISNGSSSLSAMTAIIPIESAQLWVN
jgi:hypothetical protein